MFKVGPSQFILKCAIPSRDIFPIAARQKLGVALHAEQLTVCLVVAAATI